MSAKVYQALAALATMAPAQLKDEWRRLQKTEPPRLGPDLLRLAIGYHIQERADRPQSTKAARALRNAQSGQGRSAAPQLKPGTRLLRSWNGQTISVVVTDRGFEYRGRNWSSLTAIARDVTGAGWSGPRFFGLTGDAGRG